MHPAMPKGSSTRKAHRCRSPTKAGRRCKNTVTACVSSEHCLCHAHGGPTALRRKGREHAAFFDAFATPKRSPRSSRSPRSPHSVFFASLEGL